MTFQQVTCIAETEKAILCVMQDGREVWFPQSQVHPDSEVFKRWDQGVLAVSDWIATEKGLGAATGVRPRWVFDDGGRAAAGYHHRTRGDCTCRAIAVATMLPYASVYRRLTARGWSPP